MDFISVWDTAGDDAEQVESSRALALAKSASRTLVWPFLALSTSATEVEQRLALSEPSIVAVASSSGVSYDTFLAALRSDALLLVEAKTAASGADAYRPYADRSENFMKNKMCPNCQGYGSVPAQGHEDPADVDNGYVKCPTCDGNGFPKRSAKTAVGKPEPHSVCTDCLLTSAGYGKDELGYQDGDGPDKEPLNLVKGHQTSEGDKEADFSKSRCEGCGSDLAGERHTLYVYPNEKKGSKGRPLTQPGDGHSSQDCNNDFCTERPQSEDYGRNGDSWPGYPDDDSDDRTSAERYGDAGPSYRDAGDEQDRHYPGDYNAAKKRGAKDEDDTKPLWANDPEAHANTQAWFDTMKPEEPRKSSVGEDYLPPKSRSWAMMKRALEEGVDPLTWLEAEDGGEAAPEVPGGHQETGDYSHGYSEVPSGISAVSARSDDWSEEDHFNHAVDVARQHIPIQKAITKPEYLRGFTIVKKDNSLLHSAYSDDAWEKPEGNMLPWSAPVGTPVGKVDLDGNVTRITNQSKKTSSRTQAVRAYAGDLEEGDRLLSGNTLNGQVLSKDLKIHRVSPHDSEPEHVVFHTDHGQFSAPRGRLVNVAVKQSGRSVPGLGCPHCKGGFYTEDDRTAHIRQQHPGEYSGPTADLMFAKDRIKDIKGKSATSSRGRSPFGREAAARDPQAHRFSSTGQAYNASQVSDDIHDGDVLHVPSEGVTGVLNQAWPIAIHHNGNPGEFHTLKDGTSLTDVGDYGKSLDLAHRVHSGEVASTPHDGGFDLPEEYRQGSKRTSFTSEDVLNQIGDRDPAGGERQPTAADYAAHKAWAIKTHGQDAWDAYHQPWGHQPGDEPYHVESSRGRSPFG